MLLLIAQAKGAASTNDSIGLKPSTFVVINLNYLHSESANRKSEVSRFSIIFPYLFLKIRILTFEKYVLI